MTKQNKQRRIPGPFQIRQEKDGDWSCYNKKTGKVRYTGVKNFAKFMASQLNGG